MLLLLLAVNGHPGYQMYLPHIYTHDVWTHTCNKQVMNPKSVKIIIPGISCVCVKKKYLEGVVKCTPE